jgi:large subunit ribosomal protein L22
MEFEVKLKHLHVSPRKARLVADLVRGKQAIEAQNLLTFALNKSAEPILKLLNSALANAKTTKGVEAADLYVKKITIDEGPIGRRVFPRARGRGDILRKRTSHVNLTLESKKEEVKEKKTRAKKAKKEAAVKEEAPKEEIKKIKKK